MKSSQVFDSPQHIQYFLAILQGYSSRIAAHQGSAKSLSEENRQLREQAEEIRRQNRNDATGLEMQNKLIRCQEEHIVLLEGYRKSSTSYEPFRNWTIPEPSAADWRTSEAADAFPSASFNEASGSVAEVNKSRNKKRKLNSDEAFGSLQYQN